MYLDRATRWRRYVALVLALTVVWRLVFGTLYGNLGEPHHWLEALGLAIATVVLLAVTERYC